MGNRRASGGLIGKSNKTSGGGNAVTRFNASGTFTVQKNTTVVDVLTIAGGGSGGKDVSGGGGAGGYRNLTGETVTPGGSFPITVGAGGASKTSAGYGNAGNDSVFSNPFNPITSDSGGFGGGWTQDSGDGGSGGGGGGGASDKTGGAGNTPPTTPPQGNTGGTGDTGPFGGGGGGGAGAVGAGPVPGYAGHGGIGAISSVTGTQTYYAGGGGGGARAPRAGGAGGVGGGGIGTTSSTAGGAGTTNTGSGGGGTDGGNSGAGGSGVVIVKELDKAQGVFDMKSQYTAHTKGQWPTRTGPDEISNSLMFNQPSSHFLSKTFSSPGNRRTFTISTWCKLGAATGGEYSIMGAGGTSGGNPRSYFQFEPGSLRIADNVTGSAWKRIITNAKYRDNSAWYHILTAVDTTQGTDTNRMKLYVNGTQVTSLGTADYPAQDVDLNWNDATNHYVGAYPNNGDYDFDGYLADFYFIDGQALTPAHFGEPDPDCPQIWRPKTYRGTYGTNGFHLEFKQSGTGTDSSGMGADTSGNDNHFASNNLAATDQSTDTPTNNFCTLNPLIKSYVDVTLSEGNLKLVSGNSAWGHRLGTMAVANGKWYYEAKVTSATGSSYVGWQDLEPTQTQIAINAQSDSSGTTIWYTNTANDTTGHLRKNDSDDAAINNAAIANGETVSIALDLDSSPQTITIYKDGVSVDADNTIASGNTGTLVPFISNATSGASIELNFGSPPYAISSGNADENGYGNFEYAVPSGFYALCSKNLAQYG